MPRLNRELMPWEIAARRRNAQKSTGPRSREGKRRSALNSLKWRLSTKEAEQQLAARGEDPREFRRLGRDLTALLKPFDADLHRLVGELAVEFWGKLRLLREQPQAPNVELKPQPINWRIELTLARLVTALVVRTRRWYRYLTATLGEFISSPVELRRRIEGRLPSFGARSAPSSGATFWSQLSAAADYVGGSGLLARRANLLRSKKIRDGISKTNLLMVCSVLSARYAKCDALWRSKCVDAPIADLTFLRTALAGHEEGVPRSRLSPIPAALLRIGDPCSRKS